ncbi:hypothetical protein ABB37_08109 [Leptomonas pyrrhocoris]|uniref:Leucine-rich repeat protein n=1 Tax=Leptomonas pyrrhocoris TaxID=157538 RepID=A0A0N1J4F2_LEPPY|nr:hypothetical protein ABB37_08109 [Leptomonas pyrrhocoris]KPA75951.1 hypothetical protein ABB37_08109 [Leptomonas pyrrhocoris]|eukprot:XP_015654390.1 hypothetical protein ABB37_08109 [Leptomonas pyrrhocoris]
MQLNLLTAVAGYYADYVDADAPQPSDITASRSRPAAAASLTSNLFLRYCQTRATTTAAAAADRNATPTRCSRPGTLSKVSSCSTDDAVSAVATSASSLAHSVPLAFSAAHPLARLAAERSPAGYRSGGLLIWDRPLSAAAMFPGAYHAPHRNESHPPRWGRWDSARQHEARAGDVSGEHSSSSSASGSRSSSRSSSVAGSSGTQRVVPPAPLFFSQAMRRRVGVGGAAPAALNGGGDVGEGTTVSPRALAQRETCALPATAKIVVVLRLYDVEYRSAPSRQRTSRGGYSNADDGADSDADGTVWRMMQPVLWWLERSVRPADDAASVAAAAPRVTSQVPPADHHDKTVGSDADTTEGGRSASVSGRAAEPDASQNLSLCSSPSSSGSSPSWDSAAAAGPPPSPPKLACAIRLFISPWAMPRRRRRLVVDLCHDNDSGSNNGDVNRHTSHPPASSEVRSRWCPQALVELGLCGPGSDSPVLFSAATFLAALAVNASDDDTDNDDGGGRGSTRRHAADEEAQRRRRRLHRHQRSTSGAVVPAFGPFPTPHVPSGPQWPGGGGGRRGVATWRTPACATLHVDGHTAIHTSTTTAEAPASAAWSDEETRWGRRPLLELFGLDGVWGSSAAGRRIRRDGSLNETEEDDDDEEVAEREDSGNGLPGAGRAWSSRLAPPPSLPVPLLPLHTLDLSFRADLRDLEGLLRRWAATGHLSRLSRLSLMGCIQLRRLDVLADMPADTLEVLNVSGCEELRDLRAVRRLGALRSLKATQLMQLERLGWWWSDEGGEHPTHASSNSNGEGAAVMASSLCCLRHLVELDLACFRRRTHCLEDIDWIGALPALQKLALSVSEEEDPVRQPVHIARDRDYAQHETTAPESHGFARLAWLAGCGNLRELRLAFRDGPRAGTAGGATRQTRASSSPPPPLLPFLAVGYAEHRGAQTTDAPPSDLDVLSFCPFPHLRVVELIKAILTEHFTSWLAEGCPRLRDVDLISCTVRCSAAGFHEAQSAHRAVPLATVAPRTTTAAPSSTMQHSSADRRGPPARAPPPLPPPSLRHPPTPSPTAAGVTAAATPPPSRVPSNRARSVGHRNFRHDGHLIHNDHNGDNGDNDGEDAQQRRKDEQWWWSQLCRLRHLRRLSVYDLEGLASGSSLDWVVGCTALRHLGLRKCRWLLDAYAVHRLPRLRTLNLNATGIDDLTFLRMRDGTMVHGPPLSPSGASASTTHRTHRRRREHRGGGDDDAEEGRRARAGGREAACDGQRHSAVSSPSPSPLGFFRQRPPALSHLTELVLVDCAFLSDLSPIAYLTSCRSLFASDHLVTSLDHLATCVAMEKLYLINYAKLTDIAALRWLWRLRVVYITHSSVRDVRWMAQPVTPRVEFVSHRYGADRRTSSSGSSSGSDEADGSAVGPTRREWACNEADDAARVLPRLEVLTLAYSRLLTDVSALGALPRLRHLDLRECVNLYQLGSNRRSTRTPAAVPSLSSTRSASMPSSPFASFSWSHILHGRRGAQDSSSSSSDNSREWSVRSLTTLPLSWAGIAAEHLVAHLRRWQSTAVSGWVARRDVTPPAGSTASVPTSSTGTPTPPPLGTAHRHPVTSALSSYRLRSTPPKQAITQCSIADLAPTLRYLSLSGCSAVVDAAPLGELHHLQYLHAVFTGIREVRWLRGCTSLKVLDLTMAPCCTPSAQSAAAVAFLARLSDELPELEIVNGRPVERNFRAW